ncbi:hypothetical protein HMPREF0908_1580 [Selenomonas flueggei ATCC 43531]|uniref:Uncharacterized protein n=1 Tax=Selenomonas flueggei ATCC 43531 TaxID=638302 RepID=C4V4Y6_9FIRM|nr:hypothetical protein HMPREF0908_1580 [Selenomonas flueggei ATCC 43531]
MPSQYNPYKNNTDGLVGITNQFQGRIKGAQDALPTHMEG